MTNIEIKDGEYTKTIYSMIKEQRYSEAVNILSFIYDSNPSSRAALSLLAYCYYYTQVSMFTIKGVIFSKQEFCVLTSSFIF